MKAMVITTKKFTFSINDTPDILIEVLKRLDDRSLSVAACVCRLWCSISRNDSLWENLCFRHVLSTPTIAKAPCYDVKHVVLALGGYRRLYMVCLRPILSRLAKGGESERVWTRDEMEKLSLSLFSVHCYERRLGGGGGGGGGGRVGEGSSLMFLCKPVNVS